MSYDINNTGVTVDTTIEAWMDKYKENHLEQDHDRSALTLGSPEDSLIVVGPPRLSQVGEGADKSKLYVVGFVNSLTYSETAMVQPMKAVGSRRHIFSKANGPTQGSIGRMVFYGPNLYRALYAYTSLNFLDARRSKLSRNNSTDDMYYSNLEEDLFRVPFGMGIVYRSPKNGNVPSATDAIGAEYIESCMLQNRSVALQSGQAFVMEQVSFMADRVVPWGTYKNEDETFPEFLEQT